MDWHCRPRMDILSRMLSPSSRPHPPTVADIAAIPGDMQACWDLLVRLRWPGELAPRHPVTGERPTAFRTQVRRWRFADGYEMSATVGTILERSRVPLPIWFAAAAALATHPMGLSARRLACRQGLRYDTAFHLLQRLRAGLVDPDRSPLRGIIAAGVVTLGGRRDRRCDAPVVVAVECTHDAKGIPRVGRVRFRVLDQVDTRTLAGFLGDHVALGSALSTTHPIILTDLRSLGYRLHAGPGYPHARLAMQHVTAQVSQWLAHTHGHAVSRRHLQSYLNEAAFRLQFGDGIPAFRAALGLAIHVPAPRHIDITGVRLRRRRGWRHVNPRTGDASDDSDADAGVMAYPVGSPVAIGPPPARPGNRRTRPGRGTRPKRRSDQPIRLVPATRRRRLGVRVGTLDSGAWRIPPHASHR